MGKPKQVWPGMTRRQHRGIERYMIRLAGDLHLDGWYLRLLDCPTDEDATAEVLPTDHRRRASILVAHDFAARNLDEKRHAILHELLHLVHRDTTDVMRLGLVGQLGNETYRVLWECFRQQYELWTDGMADLLLPLIDDSAYRHLLDR